MLNGFCSGPGGQGECGDPHVFWLGCTRQLEFRVCMCEVSRVGVAWAVEYLLESLNRASLMLIFC